MRHGLMWLLNSPPDGAATPGIEEALHVLGIHRRKFSDSQLPFTLSDATAGSESELQAAVIGGVDAVDLPQQIRESGFFANVIRNARNDETSHRPVTAIEKFLGASDEGVWENSWVRIPLRSLNKFARNVLTEDLRAKRSDASSGPRADMQRFLVRHPSGREFVRVPVSYLMKLCLAQFLGAQERTPTAIFHTAHRLMNFFINDNCSPETLSFNVVSLTERNGAGRALARETAKRYLVTQLLLMYANEALELRAEGQQALAWNAPTPPLRQKRLNECVSDAYYRELFCSPCLSGWDEGEAKSRYMMLCHEVLSRSQLNAVAKLRDAGIITRNLVVLPNTSNVSLSNNGTHISIGSRSIKAALEAGTGEFTGAHEKVLSDLTVKIVEHFLPLFVGTYSAAPYRYDFTEFHPEKLLGYLPHQLDFTHLRMLWTQWKQKADVKFFGHALTPVGPHWIDRSIASAFGLRGDAVPDARLLDYLVALPSTDRSPALDGNAGNRDRLKRDLADLGVFDERMAFYMLFRPREHASAGYSGFEARFYSLFHDLVGDVTHATNLQTLLTGLAFKYMASGKTAHEHIPDTRVCESERRQIFFTAAAGVQHFYVRKDTPNQFLAGIIADCERVRPSGRYRGYVKVPVLEYRRALVRVLRRDAAELITAQGMEETLRDLEERIDPAGATAADVRLNNAILGHAGARKSMRMRADDFNAAAEQYYRTGLRERHIDQALELLAEDLRALDQAEDLDDAQRWAVRYVLGAQSASEFLAQVRDAVRHETLPLRELQKLIALALITIHVDATTGNPRHDAATASIY
jgi:hypothetical protein